MKIFQTTDVIDWFIAESAKDAASATVAYYKAQGFADSDIDELDIDPIEVSDDEMQTLIYDDGDIHRTFAAQMRFMLDHGVETPCFFATTEC